jgi:hypothetical protein
MAQIYHNTYSQQRRSALEETFINEFYQSKSFANRKAFIYLCQSLVQVSSFQKFKDTFLEQYMTLAEDPVAEVRVCFINSVSVVRPFLEKDIDIILKFNNSLNNLRMADKSRLVAQAAERLEQQLIKIKGASNLNPKDEINRLKFEEALVQREKLEDEERKKKNEESDDSKFDYLTLLVNTTKKFGNMRR